jgi:hypothetical protein
VVRDLSRGGHYVEKWIAIARLTNPRPKHLAMREMPNSYAAFDSRAGAREWIDTRWPAKESDNSV